jgi:SAP domain
MMFRPQLLLTTALWATAAWPFGIILCLAFQFPAAPAAAFQKPSLSYPPFYAFFRKKRAIKSASCTSTSTTSLLERRCPTTTTALFSGTGIATNYTWKEEAFEIELSVLVPRETRASDISYKATSSSIDLRLKRSDENNGNDDDIILLDGNRKMRGRISLDGTYWVISDYNDVVTTQVDQQEDSTTTTLPSTSKQRQLFRQVTVTIEKLLKSPKNSFEVVDYDWKGVYPKDDDEVSFRQYDEAQELNVREYAESLGVDIDNINMSMVDKTMYSSGLNLTQASLDQLTKAGLVKEVTRQADGSEFVVNADSGELEPYYSALDDKELLKRTRATAAVAAAPARIPKPPSSVPEMIPFLDTDSPWHQTPKQQLPQKQPQQPKYTNDAESLAVQQQQQQFDKEETRNKNQTVIRQTREFTRSAFAQDAAAAAAGAETTTTTAASNDKKYMDVDQHKDPIDLLTVQRLKEILKSQGQKVTGSKKELQDRLRQQVNTLLQGKQEL